jgi:hypothetical protein
VWNINALPPESRKAFQRFLDMIVAAYHEGKGTQATIVDDEQGFQLAQAAITQQNSPMNTEDVKFLFSNDNSDLARRCRVRLQFENNVLSIPENVALLRWLYSKQ